MRRLRSALPLLLALALAGCGGNDGDETAEAGFAFSNSTSDYSGSLTRLEGSGTYVRNVDSVIAATVTFAQGNRTLRVFLPTVDSGTFSLGTSTESAQARYSEVGVAGTLEWNTLETGTITVTNTGTTATVTLNEVVLIPNSVDARGTFTIDGTDAATIDSPPTR